ncbi:MAG: hypothetical protein QGG29_01915 [Prochlorococcaceae cyanobacterium ETNP18_MAG_17]|nr:hypothetical protein [Prochlorococcaceae cyanobacterium ETNP18_MAG_17]
MRNQEMYTSKGKLAVNRLYRLENMQAEVNRIFEGLNLPVNPKLPKTKRQFLGENRHYQDVLNGEQAARIGLILKREIEPSVYSY